MMTTVKRGKVKRKKRNYEDRGMDQLRQDVLSDEEKLKLEQYYFSKGMLGIRNYMGMCNMRSMALRGENLRAMELADMFLQNMTSEGEGCMAIVWVLDHGKTNQFGKMEVGGSLRSKDPFWCAHGTLAQWLFFRFDISGMFPNMETSSDWYDIKLFPVDLKDQEKQMSRESHYKLVKRTFESCEIITTKV